VLFFLYGEKAPGTFSMYQVKSIAVGISKANPLAEIG